jgi:pimeloyl-ACP methyl ester carboxylesterase
MAPKSPFVTAARTLARPQADPAYGTPGRSAWLDVDWPAVTHTATVRGSEVTYVDIGEGDGDPIVWIHGLGGCWQNWLENLPHFAEGHRNIAMDLPGFGASSMPSETITIERYAQIVDELLAGLGIRRAVVVGNSMGGFIAAELAIRFPTFVSRLVLVSPAVLWQEYRRAKALVALAERSDAVFGRALTDVEPTLLRRPKLRAAALAFGGFHLPHLLSRELQSELLVTSRHTPGYLPALQALASFPIRDELSSVGVATLIIWGTNDTLVGLEQADELERLIPQARKIVYPKTGHVAMLERPARFNEDMEAFLAAPAPSRDGETQPPVEDSAAA